MRFQLGSFAAAAAFVAAASSSYAAGDAARGLQLFEQAKCVTCHSVNGKGGSAAPDLGRRVSRNFTPTVMAALMWNHGPQMWSAMESKGLAVTPLTRQDADDLYAFFFAARYFEKPGDAGRGKAAFEAKGCAECHSMGGGSSAATMFTTWKSLQDPAALLSAMWSHSTAMKGEMEKKKVKWTALTPQELSDMLVYLQNLPGMPKQPQGFAMGSEARGAQLFQAKGCQNCHQGKMALENRLAEKTSTDIATAMWNHAPKMTPSTGAIDAAEMRDILAHVWTRQFLSGAGNATRGQKTFESKGCAGCHAGGSAPQLAGKQFSSAGMVSALWQHGPKMLSAMKQKNREWPRFAGRDFADLLAFLNQKK